MADDKPADEPHFTPIPVDFELRFQAEGVEAAVWEKEQALEKVGSRLGAEERNLRKYAIARLKAAARTLRKLAEEEKAARANPELARALNNAIINNTAGPATPVTEQIVEAVSDYEKAALERRRKLKEEGDEF